MGQKVNPIGFRLGSTFSWKSRWFGGKKDYSEKMLEDFEVRSYLNTKLANAGMVQIDIERSLTSVKVIMYVSRPGVVIGKGGANLETVKNEVEKLINKGRNKQSKVRVEIKVEEVKKPDLSAKFVAERIADQLIKRYPHRRAVSQAMERVMQAGAKGVKIALSGRIGGSEIARSEKYFQGSVPTQTLRANIDYFHAPARTRSGYVGVKVWIYKGEVV